MERGVQRQARVGRRRPSRSAAAPKIARAGVLRHSIWAFAFVLGLLTWPEDAEAAPRDANVKVALTVHVATEGGLPVVSRRHIARAVRRANRALDAYGVEVHVARIELLKEGYTHLRGPKSRLRLAKKSGQDGTVHVFYVERVAMVRKHHGDRRVSGMHWRYHGIRRDYRGRQFVAVAHDAPSTTLVHELGHTFGLKHRKRDDNLMCSCKRDAAPVFTWHQGLKMRHRAKRFARATK